MDKDIIGKNIYSQETVIFIKKSENSKDATSRRDYKLFTGIGNSMSKPYQYYSTNHTLRNTFKVACRNQGWNFNDFVEIYSGEKTGRNKRYFYMLMDINKEMIK